jgi:RNA polymerase sigma factor (sigma-70 family)
MVAGIAANDPVALGATYDHYAPGLYAYCRSLLTEPAEAADAVHDTFVIAAVRLGGLREPSRLRPWLYAVARNECHRHLASREAATLEPDGTDPGDDTTDFGGPLDQAELRELVQDALAGLSLDDREIVELSMRHAFYGADLADALGVPRNQARALAARGRARLESALGALLVTRSREGPARSWPRSWPAGTGSSRRPSASR